MVLCAVVWNGVEWCSVLLCIVCGVRGLEKYNSKGEEVCKVSEDVHKKWMETANNPEKRMEFAKLLAACEFSIVTLIFPRQYIFENFKLRSGGLLALTPQHQILSPECRYIQVHYRLECMLQGREGQVHTSPPS